MVETCTVHWRSSGGRGEFEFVPSGSLVNRRITVELPSLGIKIPAEVVGKMLQGKPRLRKDEPNNRSKLHLVPLVMAAARLPDPAREDKTHVASWPLENKGFLISQMVFEIVHRTATAATLRPLSARILHSEEIINFSSRFQNIASDVKSIDALKVEFPGLSAAILKHREVLEKGINDGSLRDAADAVLALQSAEFGTSNSAALTTIMSLPHTPLEEDIKGKEGRILTRLHSYRERDRKLVKDAKVHFKATHGKVFCECCGFEPTPFYGERGADRIQAHHRLPLEELLPDSVTTAEDLAMVCPNCHDIIHAKRPWITVESLKADLIQRGKHNSK